MDIALVNDSPCSKDVGDDARILPGDEDFAFAEKKYALDGSRSANHRHVRQAGIGVMFGSLVEEARRDVRVERGIERIVAEENCQFYLLRIEALNLDLLWHAIDLNG